MPTRSIEPTPLTDADIDAAGRTLADIFANTDPGPTLAVDGYRVTLTVEAGDLVIRDGIGSHARERRIPRHQPEPARIVVLAAGGSVTVAAYRWCADTGRTLALVDPAGRVVAQTATPAPVDSRLVRAQALAAGNPVGLRIARGLLASKLAGHAALLRTRLGSPDRANAIEDHARSLDAATNEPRLREIEARAANLYFAAWCETVTASFATRDLPRIPPHWTTPAVRRSALAGSGSPRKAVDPVNALLNYAYTLGEIECRRACLALGLDAALGVLHADHPHRDSMALDLLEPLRPVIETSVLDLLAARHFRKVDFALTADGQCRLTPAVTHSLTASMEGWARVLGPIAEAVAHALAASATGKLTLRTPLTRAGNRAGNDPVRRKDRGRQPRQPRPGATCRDCGAPLPDPRRTLCGACWAPERARLAAKRAERGRASRARLVSTTGTDPTQTDAARARRVESLRADRAARDAWNAANSGQQTDRAAFAREIMPELGTLSIGAIVAALGVSESAASRMRRGTLIPHARHWPALAKLVREQESADQP